MALQLQALSVALDDQRRRQAEFDAQSGGAYQFVQFVNLTGTGEGLVQIEFPVSFVEQPVFTYGSEAKPNQPLIKNNYPTCNAMVWNWRVGYRRTSGARYWTGASVIVVTTGPANQATTLKLTLHCVFEGRIVQPGT